LVLELIIVREWEQVASSTVGHSTKGSLDITRGAMFDVPTAPPLASTRVKAPAKGMDISVDRLSLKELEIYRAQFKSYKDDSRSPSIKTSLPHAELVAL